MPARFADPDVWTPEYYQADTQYVRSGLVKDFLDNPAKVPIRAEVEDDTDTKILGNLLHDLLLLDVFSFAVCDLNRNSNDFKAFKAENPGKHIIHLDSRGVLNYRNLMGMVDSVQRTPEAMALLNQPAHAESVILWEEDEYGGMPCKCMCDRLLNDGRIIDLKTTRDSSPGKFQKQAFDLSYPLSAVWYERGRDKLLGEVEADFHWIAVENRFPYWCRVFTLTPETREENQQRLLVSMPDLANCYKTGVWPDCYAGREHPI